jgi:hypothetical protein
VTILGTPTVTKFPFAVVATLTQEKVSAIMTVRKGKILLRRILALMRGQQ